MKRALNRYRRNRDLPHLLMNYKKAKANARRIIRQAKKKSWEDLLHMFNFRTPMFKLWYIIRKFTRKSRVNRPLPVLRAGGVIVDDPVDVGNVFGQYFSEVSSAQNYSDAFRARENDIEAGMPDFDSTNQESYNVPITTSELTSAIRQSGNTTVEPDRIHYAFLKHLRIDQIQEILKLFNYI